MAGVAQVFLTHNELEEMLVAFDVLKLKHPDVVTPKMTSGFDKLELALAPVACTVASGCKIA